MAHAPHTLRSSARERVPVAGGGDDHEWPETPSDLSHHKCSAALTEAAPSWAGCAPQVRGGDTEKDRPIEPRPRRWRAPWWLRSFDGMPSNMSRHTDAAPEDVRTRYEALLDAALDVAGEHHLDQILQRMVRCAADVADARYVALGVYDASGNIERFVHHGLDPDTVARIGHLPQGRGLLGEVIVADGPIRLADLTADPRARGFPPHHPPMKTLRGVPVMYQGRVLGNLYVTDQENEEDFKDEDEL